MGVKKLLKNKIFIILVIAIIALGLGVGGYLLYTNNKKIADEKKTQKEGKTDTSADQMTEKADNTTGEVSKPETTGEPTPTVNTAVAELKEVSLTVYLVMEDTTSQDGKTSVPAGSITPYFYLPGGIYSIQKLVGATWTDVATSINYPGHGGLLASFAGPTEDNINYRALKIEGGTIKAVSKTFVVKRADMTSGYKTYN
jgi:short subunit dehydrogenase-like uncharacterized protein